MRWRLRLEEFSFNIECNPVLVNQAADALSRMPTSGTDQSDLDLELSCCSVEEAPAGAVRVIGATSRGRVL